jgi:small conductance mechanosensitive channel
VDSLKESVNVETLKALVEHLTAFVVAYGFQILGAIVVFLIGLKLASWCGTRLSRFAEGKGIDVTLSRFLGNVMRLVIVAAVVIITLGNFGVTIAPLIAIVGASAFGATLAIQGPLSNYGAGLAIILARPFVVGDTITVKGTSGVVDLITLGYTRLVGEDEECITVPNKEIVGEIIVNSHGRRVVEVSLLLAAEADVNQAIVLVRQVYDAVTELDGEPRPQVGIHGFTYGGVVLGLRYWVPSKRYFQLRYKVNGEVHDALTEAGVALLAPAAAALQIEADGVQA